MWVGFVQSVEGLNRKRQTSPEQEEIWPAAPLALALRQRLFPGSPACQLTLQIFNLLSLHNCISQFLKCSLALSFSRVCECVYVCVCLSLSFSFCYFLFSYLFI